MQSDVILAICTTISIVMNVYQLRFWSKQNQDLVNKIMSRNYPEYVQSQTPLTKPLQSEPVVSDDEVLGELNRHFPI